MHRPRNPRRAAAALTLTGLAAAFTGCSAGDASSRIAVVGEARPMPAATTLGAGDALGWGMQDVIMARITGGEAYATVTTPADPR